MGMIGSRFVTIFLILFLLPLYCIGQEDLSTKKINNNFQAYLSYNPIIGDVSGFKNLVYNDYHNKGSESGLVLLELENLNSKNSDFYFSGIGFEIPLNIINDSLMDYYFTGSLCLDPLLGSFCSEIIEHYGIIKDIITRQHLFAGMGIRAIHLKEKISFDTSEIKNEIDTYPTLFYSASNGFSIFGRISGIITGRISYRLETGFFHIASNELGFIIKGKRVSQEKLDTRSFDEYTFSNDVYTVKTQSNVDPFKDVEVKYENFIYFSLSLGLLYI